MYLVIVTPSLIMIGGLPCNITVLACGPKVGLTVSATRLLHFHL